MSAFVSDCSLSRNKTVLCARSSHLFPSRLKGAGMVRQGGSIRTFVELATDSCVIPCASVASTPGCRRYCMVPNQALPPHPFFHCILRLRCVTAAAACATTTLSFTTVFCRLKSRPLAFWWWTNLSSRDRTATSGCQRDLLRVRRRPQGEPVAVEGQPQRTCTTCTGRLALMLGGLLMSDVGRACKAGAGAGMPCGLNGVTHRFW